jgi:folate-binding protein YgfZ
MDNAFVKLPNRGLIHLEGEDRHAFLQHLITNDIKKLTPQAPLYSWLLTPQGKFLHDFYISEGNGFTLLDCEGGARAQDLYKRLNMYRLRSKVTISVEENNAVYTDFSFTRSFDKPDGVEKPFPAWDEHRIRHCIPDGSRDLLPEKDTPLECNLDKLNGVSFDKGCYVGQEITARMNLRDIVRKHLRVVEFTATPPAPFSDLIAGGKLVGQMRSSCGNVGLAMIKDEALETLGSAFRVI